nr:hypothetical protein [Tanacetum cinerariifolium]
MQNLKDISDPTTAIDMALALMTKAFTLNNTTPTNNNQRISSNPSNLQIAQLGMNIDQDRQMLMVENNVGNLFRPNVVQNVRNKVVQNAIQNHDVQNDGNYNGLSVDPGIENQYGIGNVITARAEANDGSAEVQLHDNCYDDEIFNVFTQEEQYTELLEPIAEPHQVLQNDSNVTSVVFSVEQGGRTVE